MATLALALLLWALPAPPAAQALGLVTLLEGSLRVIRGTTTFQGAEGMSLRQGDIIESSDQGFVQLEFTNGAIIALGPSSRMYILQESAGETKGEHTVALELVMLNGWFKSEFASGKRLYRYRTPLLAATTTGGNLVVHSNPNECDVFLESGAISVGEVNPSGTSGPPTVGKAGQFFSRQKGAAVVSLARPTGTFLEDMPRQFRDTLPPRVARYSGAMVEPKAGHPVTYDEIAHWLTIPPAWRKGLPERFAPRLSAPEFRKQIELHVKEFPEWEPLLHPKKESQSPQGRN
jgi:hypothetical protein